MAQNRLSWLLSTLLAGALLASLSTAHAAIVSLLDQPAPELSGGKWIGSPSIKMSKLRGSVVVLHFSDPTRIVSKGALPKLKRIWDEHGGGDLRIVEIIVSESSISPEVYVEDEKIGWPVTVDYEGKTAAAYPGTSLPRTYLIGPDGIVQWHGHVGALSDRILRGQLDRAVFFDKDRVPKKARSLAAALAKLDYRKALSLADSLESASGATDEEKAFAERAREDAERYATLQQKLLDEEVTKRDRARAWLRLKRLLKTFKGTPREAEFQRQFDEQDALARTHFVLKLRKELDDILEKAGSNRKKDVESAVARLKVFAADAEGTVEGDEANEWVRELEARLSSGSLR